MVFRGKPSRGCLTCRQKKIRCDQRVEGCSNCERLGIKCPGYRNQLDLMFVNEDPVILQRAKAGVKAAAKARKDTVPKRHDSLSVATPSSGSPAESSTSLVIGAKTPELSLALPEHTFRPSVDECGLGYFYTYHVGVPGTGSRDWSTNNDDELLAAMKALGLAGLSRTSHNSALMRQARSHYVVSIQRLNNVLQDVELAKKDSTLLTILALGVFEQETGSNQKNLDAWVQHVHGATALLELRGPEQFKSTAGRTLFGQMLFSLTIACMRQGLPIPPTIYKLRKEVSKYVIDLDHPLWRLTETGLLLADFHHAVNTRKLSDPFAIINRALEIDNFYVSIFDDMIHIPEWQYRIILGSNPPESPLPSYYHIYPHFFTSQHWIFMRTARIFLHEIILKILPYRSPSCPTTSAANSVQKSESTAVLLDLQQDIIAAIPQYLSSAINSPHAPQMPGMYTERTSPPRPGFLWSQWPDAREFSSAIFRQSRFSELPMLRLGGGNGVIFPLQIVGLMSVTGDEVRQWVVDVLCFIGRDMGVGAALALVAALQKGAKVVD